MTGVFDAFWVATALRLATPLVFAASGELVAERAGILNIGLEGMMLVGSFTGFLVTWATGSPALGIVAGMVCGALLAVVMALLAVVARADQIVVGIGLNIAALGITSFAFREIFSGEQVTLDRPRFALPVLADLPFVGEALFREPLVTYLAIATMTAVWFLLYRTSWGLAIRAAGEVPEAVEAAGLRTAHYRWAGTLIAGALAGVGGAFLSIELGVFVEGMTAGRGFLALAAVIFGRWRPAGVLGACLVFGAADALQLRLQGAAFAVALPAQLWRTAPYILSLVMLAGAVGRSRMPSALAVAFRRRT
jgi:simple sugar transport system permease protein